MREPSNAAPTIVDVARVAGVSKSTISRVLNDSDNVLPATVERVRQAMDALGYQANLAARSLRTSKSQLVGVMVPSLNEAYGAQAEGADAVFQANALSTVISCFGWDPDRFVRVLDTLTARRLDGLVLWLPDDTDPTIRRAVTGLSTPFVLVDREVPGAIYDAVITDQTPGMREAITQLVSVGRRRVGIILQTTRTYTGRAALASYAEGLQENGLAYRPDWIVQSDVFRPDAGIDATRRLLSLGIDALIVAAPAATLAGAIEHLRDAGIRYPQDISLIGYHMPELAVAMVPSLSVITRDLRQVGEFAAELLLERLVEPSRLTEVRMVPTSFVAGGSSDPSLVS